MNVLARYHVAGGGAREIAASVEAAVRAGRLVPGDSLPTVRDLAGELGVSPGTGAAAYAELRRRGLVVTAGRRGTRVRGRPPLPAHPVTPSRAGISDLGAGAPDPELLPALGPVLARLAPPARLYGEAPNLPELVELARGQLDRDGVPPGPVAVVSGALDGIERVLVAHTRPGDRVAVEDPGYPPVFDLLATLDLTPEPVRLDRAGPARGALRRALEARAVALVVTPRAQNPTGATLGAGPLGVEDARARPAPGGAVRRPGHRVAGRGPPAPRARLGQPPAAGDRRGAVGRRGDRPAARPGRRGLRGTPRRAAGGAGRPRHRRRRRLGPERLGAGAGGGARGRRPARRRLGGGGRRALPAALPHGRPGHGRDPARAR